ncbi:hypothetical protein NP511_17800 [Natrinema thermotolerans]|uniref:Uncharacterized protein n=1 Tax=Natrinema thermotolerans TaxID=121872 RepID=A0AAF0PB16_9EURY|nr:hypothetical protein [Natrinema thermotolerans]QCC60214.1 hypothetical protein DVR14_16890 [Natrinema thermotolerans]QCC61124.1 hypothetical protein DVR14_21010 [Natrinema thermotolerans]WMT07229.1 hypothetical protein NP511_17800 [Natrinema thermotolerans]
MTDIDTVLTVLSSHRRRYILYYLEDHGSAKIQELARSEVEHTQMVHRDLPRLADVGYIMHDDERIEYDPCPLLERFLDVCKDIELGGGERSRTPP